MLAALLFLSAVALGLAVVRACGLSPRSAEGLAAAPVVGLGVASVLGFAALVAFGRLTSLGLGAEIAVGLGLAAWLARRGAAVEDRGSWSLPTLAAWVALLALASSFLVETLRLAPLGGWDAVAIWNVRARFLFRATDWTVALETARGHPDYPLLLPLTIARGWRALGHESPGVPHLAAGLFLVATAGLLGASVAKRRGRLLAFAAGAVFLAAPVTLRETSRLQADGLLAFFVLLTCVAVADRRFALAGLAAALGAWTKNEGLLLLLLCGLFVAVPERRVRPFLTGAAPALLAVVLFKVAFSPTNNLVEGQDPEAILARLTDSGRYVEVVRGMGIHAGRAFGLALYAVPVAVLLLRPRLPSRDELSVTWLLAGLVLGYAVVYLLTPNDLPRHLDTSCERLWFQLFPAGLFAALGTWTRAGASAAAAPVPAPDPAASSIP